MIFNGHTSDTVDNVDEETFADICVLYSDGLLTNKAVYDALAPITTAIFNYLRDPNSIAYKTTQIFPWIVEYEQNPDLDVAEQEKISNGLIGFVSQAKGFNLARFQNANVSTG